VRYFVQNFMTAAMAERRVLTVNRSGLDHREAGNSLEIPEVQRRDFVAEMQGCRANQQVLERKLDAYRFLLALDVPREPRDDRRWN